MVTYNEIAKILRTKAKQSVCSSKVSAIGFNKNGDIINTSCNRPRFNRKGGGIHAEKLIMHQAKRKGITNIIIARINRLGKFLPIEPCVSCKKTSEKLGIKIVSISEIM